MSGTRKNKIFYLYIGKLGFLFSNYVIVLILLHLYLNKVSKLSNSRRLGQELDVTYSHVHKVLVKLEKLELITKVKIGRENKIKLTDKGKEISSQIYKLKEIYERK